MIISIFNYTQKKSFLFFFILPAILAFSNTSFGSTPSPVNDTTHQKVIEILKEIKADQGFKLKNFPEGAFKSYRKYYYGLQRKADYNLFFSAMVIYNLQRYQHLFTADEMILFNQIKSSAIPYFEKFKNKKNNLTYNFWPKNPPQIFPNGGWLNLLNKRQALPDDIDDCAMLTLALGNQDTTAEQLRNKFKEYSIGGLKPAKSFYKKYNKKPVYSTWLGNRMPKDIDICVLSNVLLMNYTYHLKLQPIDTASLDLIIALLVENKHLKDAAYVSKQYSNSATIIYHIARLMVYSDYKPLLALKPKIISDAHSLLVRVKQPLEKLLLYNSLLQLGDHSIKENEISREELYKNKYPYFIANMNAIFNNPLNRIVTFTKIGKFTYYSHALDLSLLLENILLSANDNQSRLKVVAGN